MKFHDLLMEFLRNNGLKLTERYLGEERGSKPKLIRCVKGNRKYSIVFTNEEPVLHIFKEKLWTKRPYKSVATVSGAKGNLKYNRTKIEIDFNDPSSFKKILSFIE